jgi:hypothetical protein
VPSLALSASAIGTCSAPLGSPVLAVVVHEHAADAVRAGFERMTRDRLRMDATSENQDPRRRDVLALHLLQKVGIRKGALQGVQFRHFNHAQKRLTIFTKGGKVQTVPVVDRPSGTSSSATFSIGARRLTNI